MPIPPCIITAAITGSVPRKENNPAVPITVSEQIESTHACYEAGAALVHVHVRNDDQSTTSNPDKFADFLERIRVHCPDMIVQFSTGGRSGVGSERGGMLHLQPDMASLSTGSCNFPTRVYENPPDLILELADKMTQYGVKPEIEVFDLAMLYNAINYVRDGAAQRRRCTCSSCSASSTRCRPSATSSSSRSAKLRELMPDATWVAAGIGRYQTRREPLVPGDGRPLPHRPRGQRALGPATASRRRTPSSWAASRALCAEYGRAVATPAQAREILGLN